MNQRVNGSTGYPGKEKISVRNTLLGLIEAVTDPGLQEPFWQGRQRACDH